MQSVPITTKRWVRILPMARCTRYNIMWSSLSVTHDRSVVGFLHQLNWLSQYNWNIVESGIKHHIMVNLNTWAPYIFCQQYNLSSNQCNLHVYILFLLWHNQRLLIVIIEFRPTRNYWQWMITSTWICKHIMYLIGSWATILTWKI